MAVDWDKAVLGPLEAVFGEVTTPDTQPMYYPVSGTAFPVDGIFDGAYRDIRLEDPLVGTTAAQPVFGIRLAAFAIEPDVDDELYLPSQGKRYLVKEVRPDSHGWAKLMLGEM